MEVEIRDPSTSGNEEGWKNKGGVRPGLVDEGGM